jgi:hypothetical protein
MFAHLPEAEAAIQRQLAEGRHNDALANLVVAVHNHYKLPSVAHRHLYYPVLDEQIRQLSVELESRHPNPAPERALSHNDLIIASELYPVGGHSRVVEDFAGELESPTLVLSDVFSSYRKEPRHLDRLLKTFGDTSVVVLPQSTLWEKCRGLMNLTRRLQPRNIFYFNHHQDPLPFVGTLGHPGSRKTLVHHADHNPSLGITLPGLTHVDLTDELAATCAAALKQAPKLMPLYVSDAGRKSFSAADAGELSFVTSGTQVKFARSGPMALQQIAQTVLANTRGQFMHIGPLDADWAAEIRNHLQQDGIDPARFVAVGPVDSLWATLLSLPAHVYLASAPIGGARATIEAQGCGYPVIFHRIDDPGSLVAVESLYATRSLGWTHLADLPALMAAVANEHASLSGRSRALYEQLYSRQEFRRALAEISQR